MNISTRARLSTANPGQPNAFAITGLPTRRLSIEAVYICDSCGGEIVVLVDASAGSHQDYVEDCPVCCHPMTLHVNIAPDGEAHVQGENEQKHGWLAKPRLMD